MAFSVILATAADAAAIAALRNAATLDLTIRHGRGHWSSAVSERGTLRGIMTSHVLVARDGQHIAGTLSLVTKKPWAIDPAYFVKVARPLYLVNMSVAPELQRQGVGRRLLGEATAVARAWPAGAIRLDAYDGPAGAGAFYASCGYREVGRVVYRTVPLIYYELVL